MIELCNCDVTYNLKVEADIGADAIWCNECLCNFEITDVPISSKLRSELAEWKSKYGEWIDWENDGIFPNGVEHEEEHNKQGLKLTEKVKKELEGEYKVSFKPSTFAKRHENKKLY